MISDVLSDAVVEIDRYLVHPGTRDCYTGAVREAIVALRDKMTALREVLDAPPPVCACYADDPEKRATLVGLSWFDKDARGPHHGVGCPLWRPSV